MPTNALKALPKNEFDYWKAQHLLNRAGFGGTPSQVRALANLGLDGAVDHIVDYESPPEMPGLPEGDRFDPDIMRPATADERQAYRRARERGDEEAVEEFRKRRQQRQHADRQQVADLQEWWLARMIETPRPLEEKLTLFWHGHFATGYRAIEDSYLMYRQNEFFRKNATGNFSNLVHGIIRDPAMIRYLNNDRNSKRAPNENLARELMELFTLGEGHDYTEHDIKEGARALTGYTFQDNEFVFRQRQHDDGTKTILGKRGNLDGADFCNAILSRRVCSEYICWKLYRFFVNDLSGEPSEEAQQSITRLAKLMRDKRYELKPVLKTMFRSAHFYNDMNVTAQIKSPVQLIVQAIRSLHTPTRSLRTLLDAAGLMGQSPLQPPSVKGWDGGRAWINTSTLFVRQNLMIYLLTGRRADAHAWQADGSVYDAMHLIEHLQRDGRTADVHDAIVYLLRFNLGREPHEERVAALEGFVREHGGKLENAVLIGVLSLIAAMPEYQLC